MNPATQIVFSTTQAILVFVCALASAFGVAYALGRFSKSQDILAAEVRHGFRDTKQSLLLLNTFREDALQRAAREEGWKTRVDQELERHEKELASMRMG